MFCKICGCQIAETSKFCPCCGNPRNPGTPAVTADPVSFQPIDSAPIPPSQMRSSAPIPEVPTPVATENPKKKSAVVPLMIVILILSLALLAVTALLVLPGMGVTLPWTDSKSSEDREAKKSSQITDDPEDSDKSADGSAPAQTDPPEPTSPSVLSENNPYSECMQNYAAYIMPDSDSKYLCYQDIARLSAEERQLAAQEIYARQGQTFTDAYVQEYFDNRSWYSAGGSFQANTYEQANLDLLEIYEAVQDGSWKYSGNPYIDVFDTTGEYVMPHSNTRYLTANELKQLSAVQLELMRNEIFARRGFLFADTDLRYYFFTKPWYKPTVYSSDFDSSVFNQFEYSNVKLIKIYEMRERGVAFSSDNPYRQYYSAYRNYIFADSDDTRLQSYQLAGMTADKLCLARNEILARHGYTFKDQHLLEYFLQFDWYLPNTPEGDGSSIQYNEVELNNIDLLLATEKGISSVPDASTLNRTLNYTVSTDCFRITLPAYFKTYGSISVDYSAVSIRENVSASFGDGFGGFLYSFQIAIDESDYNYLPQYTLLGKLTSPNGIVYDVFARFPSDIQFASEVTDLYQAMGSEYSRIAASFQGINGYTFIPV